MFYGGGDMHNDFDDAAVLHTGSGYWERVANASGLPAGRTQVRRTLTLVVS